VPARVPYANLTNPQTLNLYAMVSDNPETFADLDGHGVCPGIQSDHNPCPKPANSTPPPPGGKDPNSHANTGDGIPQSKSQQAQQHADQQQNQQPSTQDYLNAIKKGAAGADNFIKKVELPAVAPEYAAAGGAVVAGEEIPAATGAAARAVGQTVQGAARQGVGLAGRATAATGAALRATQTALDNAAETTSAIIESRVPGSIEATGGFIKGALTSQPVTTMPGLYGRAAQMAIKFTSWLLGP